MPKPILWIVIPCYNEEAVLPITAPLFLQKINDLAARGLVSDKSRVLFVNDGSKDKTWELIQGFAKQDEHFIGIAQSRNRGHQNAVLAGLMEALHSGSCDITISIDCDGQDDINAMDEMVQKYLDGAEVVYGVRSRRDTDTFFKRFTAEGFYHVMNALGADIVFNHADYRLISTRVLESFADYHEVNIFLRGMVPLVGFPHDVVTYERHERPTDVAPEERLQPRLGQRVALIPTDQDRALRVMSTLRRQCGRAAALAVTRAACSDEPDAGTAVYRFVRYAIDEQKHRACEHCRKRASCAGRGGMGPCPKQRGRAFSDITHPAVERLFRISRSVGQECEHMRQFVRFQHLAGEGADVWFARVNPKASVVPLIMDHFVERLGVQPFIIYDEVHHLAGVYDGGDWQLVNTEGAGDLERALPDRTADEALMSEAWRTFYKSVSIDARYHPELRRQFMPKRFWKNLTELQESPAALRTALR